MDRLLPLTEKACTMPAIAIGSWLIRSFTISKFTYHHLLNIVTHNLAQNHSPVQAAIYMDFFSFYKVQACCQERAPENELPAAFRMGSILIS
jgi:hypothetical protein